MKPVLDLPILIPILVILLGIGIYASWRSTHHAPSGLRKILITLRILALSAIAILLLNPGKWVDKSEQHERIYPIMIDDSVSMSTLNGELSRSDTAKELTNLILTQAKSNNIQTQLFSFSDDVKTIDSLDQLTTTGNHSNIHQAGSNLFTQLQASGDSPEAIILLTDGRQTSLNKNSTLALQSRANNAPIYALSIGADVLRKDLELTTTRNTITAFPKQNLQITAIITNHHLPTKPIALILENSAGKQIATQKLEVAEQKTIAHTFSVEAPEKSTTYKLRIAPQPDEQITDNNQCLINARILHTKTRVFIAEGAPYWDSKFLAQLLRQQGHMNVHSVHRLRDDRWFRIDSGQSDPTASSDDVFPDTPEKLSKYDLIIFGKNSEYFLTEDRIEALKSFVRDQGGAILFSRGKPYSGRLPALETIEPVNWASGSTSTFALAPTEDGQSAGLFGRALPAPDSQVWQDLPTLKDAHNVDSVKPFTRVLAEGSLPGNRAKFPLLLVRRYGQGATALVNADGLWKWDFYPEARELGNMYQEFWTQLIQWVVAYSEFLPGHDYSLHASNQSINLTDPIVFSLGYRGSNNSTTTPPKPTVEITSLDSNTDPTTTITPASSTPSAGKPTWKCSYIPTTPGSYTATLITDDSSPSPVINFTVNKPPTEMDNLNPDPTFLKELCESTGGKILTPEEFPTFITNQFSTQNTQISKTETIWQSSWLKWFTPLILLTLLSADWWLRRRNGLI
ncbi:MAG: hypothetical protein ACSHX6_13345 [Akkermansiaceae bacterium]